MGRDAPSIADYALLADHHGSALVARDGSLDWCCLPRYDTGGLFCRLLDPDGGSCAIAVDGGGVASRRYLEDSLVLESTLRGPTGEARLLDLMPLEDPLEPAREHRAVLRVLEGVRGSLTVTFTVTPRFDYGEVRPWLRHHGRGVYSAIGGDDGLLCVFDAGLRRDDDGGLVGTATVRGGERVRLLLAFRRPEEIDRDSWRPVDGAHLDAALEDTLRRWRAWSSRTSFTGPEGAGVRRSAIALKALIYAPTGAMVAAPTTSLPESLDGEEHRTWDYRYAWIRDSVLATHCLTELGHDEEADAFRRFVERSAAGSADDLLVCYGVGGERRMPEQELSRLRGYRGAGPVRVGNQAAGQLQLDAYGHLLEQSASWSDLGHPPDDDYWRFLLALVDAAATRWQQPDRGIWEWRGEPRHFVHSKAMCWVALDRGIALAERSLRQAPLERWRAAREEVREAVLTQGFDEERGTFVQAFGSRDLDAAVLRLPSYGFIPYDDPRMLGTVEAIQAGLGEDGLLRRYDADDGMGREGAFLACTFWLAECLAGQGRAEEARAVFTRALETANDLGLFAEEAEPASDAPLGNFPQALTHLAHIQAALALSRASSV